MYLFTMADIFAQIRGFLFDPARAFGEAKGDSFGESLTYLAVLTLIFAVLAALLAMLGVGGIGGVLGIAAGAFAAVAVFFFMFIIVAIAALIGTVWLHIWVFLVGGRGGIDATWKAVVYSLTPALLFGWIPVIGLIANLWTVALEVIGIRELHELSTARAVLAVVLPYLLLIVLAVLALAFYLIPVASHGPVPVPV
jgi:hypothetical protein